MSIKQLSPRHLYTYTEKARQQRLAYLSKHMQCSLDKVANNSFDASALSNTIEGFIGSVEVPVGIGGPLQIHGLHAQGLFYAPFATTEGALIASISRGATAITRSGGATARVLGQRMMRVPHFEFGSVIQAMAFSHWVVKYLDDLRSEIANHSRYAQLVALTPQIIGRSVHLHFIYETAAAAGQNMTTTCTWHACQWILDRLAATTDLKPHHFMIDGNLSSDKKVSYQSQIHGRGTRVIAEVHLSAAVCKSILRVTPVQLINAYHHVAEGAVAAGMVGMNINVANVIAALFTALGQDIACVHESSVAHLRMALNDDGELYCSITLPSLVIGTVGGGTHLPHQRECLNMLGCSGPEGTGKLAEIIASYCLALDISTLSAIAADEFAKSHEKLGRNRPQLATAPVALTDLNVAFFHTAAYNPVWGSKPPVSVEIQSSSDDKHSLLTTLSARHSNRLMGLIPVTLTNAARQDIPVMLKLKPLDQDIFTMMKFLAEKCSPALLQAISDSTHLIEFFNTHCREVVVMNQQDPRLTRYMPMIYGVIRDDKTQTYALIEERLHGLALMDTTDQIDQWQPCYIETAIAGMAEIHAVWLGQEQALLQKFPEICLQDTKSTLAQRPLLHAFADFMAEKLTHYFTPSEHDYFLSWVENAEVWCREIEQMPRTLVHNDFNPRNIAFRQVDEQLELCVWDWELATLHLPQRDLVELLVFSQQADISPETVTHYLELHRQQLEQHSQTAIDPIQWQRGYVLALHDFWLRRIPFYLMAHHVSHYPFIDRAMQTLRKLIELTRTPLQS
ncbi:hydroxymethylglutaryl-CoA reductase [Budviciaceae bacterium BWR-B9]|uniref:Hydroxymethylglutaryl-CoA reductase n=1 Tax=Limnobaculum allomyrinae TaxID=2791986 RepID=A0ABS1ITV6_9GAMM|nr:MULTISPECIES: hydroxymethylglutaryl-CoA reductase [Limnobaculum]MBK5145184.1 hydroxymethylglutaryl-CoA reductase [Limnobaculum allomyrinae]MBV7693016.1 hydroxymethylglutaryl-CoA reductase [Limnobaculum sp. M2-1]